MQKKPTITPDLLGTNPFLPDLVIFISQVERKGAYHDDEGINIPVLTSREQTTRLMVYTTAERRLIRNQLPLRSKELLLWIMDELQYAEDFLWINWQRYEKELGVTRNTRVAAMRGLIDHKICEDTAISNVYWINPDQFFKGNRVIKYPNNLFHTRTGAPAKVVSVNEKAIIYRTTAGSKRTPGAFDFDAVDLRKAA